MTITIGWWIAPIIIYVILLLIGVARNPTHSGEMLFGGFLITILMFCVRLLS